MNSPEDKACDFARELWTSVAEFYKTILEAEMENHKRTKESDERIIRYATLADAAIWQASGIMPDLPSISDYKFGDNNAN